MYYYYVLLYIIRRWNIIKFRRLRGDLNVDDSSWRLRYEAGGGREGLYRSDVRLHCIQSREKTLVRDPKCEHRFTYFKLQQSLVLVCGSSRQNNPREWEERTRSQKQTKHVQKRFLSVRQSTQSDWLRYKMGRFEETVLA